MAPSKIISAMSRIPGVPVSRESTSRASHSANRMAMTPTMGTIQTIPMERSTSLPRVGFLHDPGCGNNEYEPCGNGGEHASGRPLPLDDSSRTGNVQAQNEVDHLL